MSNNSLRLKCWEPVQGHKVCNKCMEMKPITSFHKKLNGLSTHCKQCRSLDEKARYELNKNEIKANVKKYRVLNIEKVALTKAENYKKNADSIKLKVSVYAKNHVDDIKKYSSIWRTENREVVRVHNQNYRIKKRENGGVLSKELPARLLRLQKGKCACCAQPLGNNYHLDHIMPLTLGGTNTDDNIQLLRARCNMQKHAKHPIDFMRSRGFLL